MSGAARYAAVLRSPHVLAVTSWSVLARVPLGITSLALVLFLREETGSYAAAGVVAAGFAIATGLTAPLLGRLVDRRTPQVLVPLALTHGAALAAVVPLARADVPVPVLVLVALVGGAAFPPISSVGRALLPGMLARRPDVLPAAFALDSVLIEVVFVGGPLIVAAFAALGSPGTALLLASGCLAGGTLGFVATAPARAWVATPVVPGSAGPLGALTVPGIRTLVLATVPFGFCIGAIEVAVPAFSEDRGHPELAGVLLATWSVASAVGGLVFGARITDATLTRTWVRFALVLPLGIAPLLLAPSVAAMALLILPAGALNAPLLSTGNQLVSAIAPAGLATEAYTWPLTSLLIGIAAGNAAGGALAEAVDWRAAVTAAVAAALVSSVVAQTRRGTLGAAVAT